MLSFIFLLLSFSIVDAESDKSARKQLEEAILSALFDMNVPAVCAMNQVFLCSVWLHFFVVFIFLRCLHVSFVKWGLKIANCVINICPVHHFLPIIFEAERGGLDSYDCKKDAHNFKGCLNNVTECNALFLL